MRPFVLASLLLGTVLAAPGVHARVEVVADAAQHAWTDEAKRQPFAQTLSRQDALNGSFAPGNDQAAVDPSKAAVVDIAVVSPVRRNVMARAKKDEVATLPEPATWVMLLLGFGAMGAALRWKLRRSEERFNAKIRRIEAGESA